MSIKITGSGSSVKISGPTKLIAEALLPPNTSVPEIATPIGFPTVAFQLSGTGSNVLNNVAWYSFTLSDTTNVQLDTIGSNNGQDLDTMIALYDSAGTYLEISDDDGGGSGWSLINTVQDAGTYYLAVSYFNLTSGDSFTATTNNQSVLDPIILNAAVIP